MIPEYLNYRQRAALAEAMLAASLDATVADIEKSGELLSIDPSWFERKRQRFRHLALKQCNQVVTGEFLSEEELAEFATVPDTERATQPEHFGPDSPTSKLWDHLRATAAVDAAYRLRAIEEAVNSKLWPLLKKQFGRAIAKLELRYALTSTDETPLYRARAVIQTQAAPITVVAVAATKFGAIAELSIAFKLFVSGELQDDAQLVMDSLDHDYEDCQSWCNQEVEQLKRTIHPEVGSHTVFASHDWALPEPLSKAAKCWWQSECHLHSEDELILVITAELITRKATIDDIYDAVQKSGTPSIYDNLQIVDAWRAAGQK